VAATGAFEVHQQEERELIDAALIGARADAPARSVA
jgi:hypothetical protein